MEKILMEHNRKYKLDKIREVEIGGNNWLTMAHRVKSLPIWKVALVLVGIVTFIVFNYWLNEMLFLRDLKLFTTGLI